MFIFSSTFQTHTVDQFRDESTERDGSFSAANTLGEMRQCVKLPAWVYCKQTWIYGLTPERKMFLAAADWVRDQPHRAKFHVIHY